MTNTEVFENAEYGSFLLRISWGYGIRSVWTERESVASGDLNAKLGKSDTMYVRYM